MRDTYIFAIFLALIISATLLAYTKVAATEIMFIPLVTGFLGLLADKPRNGVYTRLADQTSQPPSKGDKP